MCHTSTTQQFDHCAYTAKVRKFATMMTAQGYRTMSEFVQAMHDVENLDRSHIRERAIARFSTETVGGQYYKYFKRLEGLWGDGFYG